MTPCPHTPERVAHRRYEDGRVESRERCMDCGEEILRYAAVVRGEVLETGGRRLPDRRSENARA